MATTVNRVYKVTTSSDPLRIRSGPGTSHKVIGTKSKGSTFTCTQLSDDGKWAYDSSTEGWLCIDAGAGYNYLTAESYGEGDPQNGTTDTTGANNEAEVPVDVNDINSIYDAYMSTFEEYQKDLTNNIPVKTIKGILGIPYQLMSQTDARLRDEYDAPIQFGRKYAEKIMTKLPLLFITPGKPAFLKGFKDDTKKNVLTKLTEKFTNFVGENSTLEEILNNESGRYYTFNMDYANYYKYVNPMCQVTARYLGIEQKELFGTKLDVYDWAEYTDPAFKTYVSAKESLGFYVDSPTNISDSFSNSTGASMIAGMVDSGSELAREVDFLLGAGAGLELEALKEENYETTMQAMDKVASQMNGLEIFSRLKHGLVNVAMGGKILFPEIWNDSEFSRSYDIDIKLRTPSGDKLSWYLNILVPVLHLIALTAPKQMVSDNKYDANAYHSPFLVRAFYKGLFNIDMGIIESLSISKGNQASWTVDGLPTEVDVNLRIKDLYSALSITTNNPKKFVNNTSLMDYLANSCGININKPEIMRSLDIYFNQLGYKFTNWPSEVWTGFQNSLSNGALNIYSKWFGF